MVHSGHMQSHCYAAAVHGLGAVQGAGTDGHMEGVVALR